MSGKGEIGGVAETMLQTLYARAKESKKPNHKIYLIGKLICQNIVQNLSRIICQHM